MHPYPVGWAAHSQHQHQHQQQWQLRQQHPHAHAHAPASPQPQPGPHQNHQSYASSHSRFFYSSPPPPPPSHSHSPALPPRQSTFPPAPVPNNHHHFHTRPLRAYTDPHGVPPPTPPRPSPVPSFHQQSPSAAAPPLPLPPPQVPQAFGHGAPAGYQFRYSNCSGRRKALLIGINYFGQPNQLRGCINDVTQMSIFLNEVHGYRREDMVILTDDQQNPMSQPTKANIIRAMHWLVKDAMPNDSLFIHFSGHGGRTPDLDGDEDDGFDDVIYPVDYKVAGHIVDDDMHDIMVKPLRPGVRLTAVFDSCHSGTALDLPFIYSTQGILKEPNLAKDAAQDILSAFSAYEKGDLGAVATTAIGLFKKATIGGSARERSLMTKTSPADVVMFSGSKDSQTSADTFQGGQARGALSWAFIESLKKYPNQSYLQLLNTIRARLEKKYSQKPQLSCSHPLDVNLLFVM